MAREIEQLTFYEEYIELKRTHLLSMMDYLISKMQTERCNVRHYKQWEAEMTYFKEEYSVFKKNVVEWLNEGKMAGLEENVGFSCEELEEKYEVLAQIFLEKRDEIREKTTFFETRQASKTRGSFLVLPFKRFDIHIFAVKMRRKP